MGGARRRQKSLRIGVHHANAVVWGPVYRTHLVPAPPSARFFIGDADDVRAHLHDVGTAARIIQIARGDRPGMKARSIHWSPYDRVRVVNADP